MSRERQEQPLSDEETARKAKLRCMKLLEYSDKTELQLRRRLEEGGFPPFAVDGAIEYVKQFHYLDDRRFAENYALQQSGKKSMKRIAQDLVQKGVDTSCIEDVLEQCSDQEEETAMHLLEKHAHGKDMTQEKVQWSQIRYLTGKGFSYDLSRRAVQRYSGSMQEGKKDSSDSF